MLTPLLRITARMPDLELISVVYISICPASTTPDSAIVFNPEVSLYGRGQVRGIIPEDTTADAHARRNEVPQIPLSDYIGTTVELTAVDVRRTSWRSAREVIAFEVGTYQDRTRGISRAGQEALGTPQIQIMTDQEIMRPLLAALIRGTAGWPCGTGGGN